MEIVQYVRMALWSFLGIRRRAAATEELSKVKPLALAAVAVILATTFGVTLWMLASFAASSFRA